MSSQSKMIAAAANSRSARRANACAAVKADNRRASKAAFSTWRWLSGIPNGTSEMLPSCHYERVRFFPAVSN